VLHRMLSGRSPLERAREDELARGIADADIDATLPDEVRHIVERATCAERTERYANAEEMAEECGAALAKRLAGDARTTMRKWIAGVRPEPTEEDLSAVKPRARMADLFSLELVEDSEPQSLRRFASVLVDPVRDQAEDRAADELDDTADPDMNDLV